MKWSPQVGLAMMLLAWPSSSVSAQSGIITTVAGPAVPVNGSLATSQAIDYPSFVAPDNAGGFYVASTYLSRLYRVAADGKISLVAGNGIQGYSGDGGPAASAQLGRPQGIAVDPAGNLFIADTVNNRIRKATPGGMISTVAGMGSPAFGGDGGPATSAQLSTPYGVTVNTAGRFFIASGNDDTLHLRVERGWNTSPASAVMIWADCRLLVWLASCPRPRRFR